MTIRIVTHILKLILPPIIDIARKHDVISSIYEPLGVVINESITVLFTSRIKCTLENYDVDSALFIFTHQFSKVFAFIKGRYQCFLEGAFKTYAFPLFWKSLKSKSRSGKNIQIERNFDRIHNGLCGSFVVCPFIQRSTCAKKPV